MCKSIGTWLVFGVLWIVPLRADPEQKKVLEDFESYDVAPMPLKGWKEHGGESEGEYRVAVENGNHFLSARDHGKSVKLFREARWKLETHPILSWRWRVKEFPKGSDERDSKKNDSAAGVYVLFPKRWFIPETIKYVWSELVPVGTVIKRRDHFPALVIRTGKEGMAAWQEERRNVAEDYKTLFGRSAPDPLAFGFLTDANAVDGTAAADYDDIVIFAK